jgi:uncharacterized membrane protein YkvA (DUF1232 family)
MKNSINKDQGIVNNNFDNKINDKKVKGLWFFKDIKTMYKMLKDNNVSMSVKVTIVGALAYFVCPVDAIPDIAPIVGYLDDAGVISAAIRFIKSQVDNYE